MRLLTRSPYSIFIVPIDVHDRAVTSRIAPAAHVEAVEKKLDALPLAAARKVAVPAKVAEAHDEVLRLAEEQLQVGKQLVETGRTRVRRFVTEREASADVTRMKADSGLPASGGGGKTSSCHPFYRRLHVQTARNPVHWSKMSRALLR